MIIHAFLILGKTDNMIFSPRWMMDPEFEADDYEYYNTDEEEKDYDNYNPFDEYRNDVIYDSEYYYNLIDNDYYINNNEDFHYTYDE